MVAQNKIDDEKIENQQVKKEKSASGKSKKSRVSTAKKKESIRKEYDLLNEKYLRLNAEYANYKRRTEKEKGELGTYVRADVFLNLLTVKDDFNRLLDHLDEDKEKIVEGINLIAKKIDQYFEKYNVKPINALGQPFDPELHEALMMMPVEDEEDDHKVQQVLEEGYQIADRVIRHSRVVVGKKD